MSSGLMANDKIREIDEYLQTDKSANLNRVISITLKGKTHELPVYRFPTSMLTFNLENTRFEVQKMREERENGEIDQNTDEGKKRLIRLLLNKPGTTKLSSDAKALMEDMSNHNQRDPGVITADGAVLNGNRRLACLLSLNEVEPNSKYQYFNAAKLPEGTSEEECFRIEADLQWANEFKVGYDPLNKYMMLKKAMETWGMKEKEIVALTRRSKKEIKAMIDELKFIEEYLNTTSNLKDFSQVEGQTEVFTDAVKQLRAYNDRGGSAKETLAYKKLIFLLVNTNVQEPNTITYKNIRDINTLYGSGSDIIKQYEFLEKSHSVEDIAQFRDNNTYSVIAARENNKPEKLIDEVLRSSKKLNSILTMKKISPDLLEKLNSVKFIVEGILERYGEENE